MDENTLVSPKKVMLLEIESILSPGNVETEDGICELCIMGERDAMGVFYLDGAEGEYWLVLCPVSYKMGELQVVPWSVRRYTGKNPFHCFLYTQATTATSRSEIESYT